MSELHINQAIRNSDSKSKKQREDSLAAASVAGHVMRQSLLDFDYSDSFTLSNTGNNMTRATQYVNHMYSLYDGRAAVTVGVNIDSDSIHPFVFEDTCKVPIGLIALSADGVTKPTDVDIYHISAFMPGKGQGTQIIKFLCDSADEYSVRLCVQAEALHNGNQTMTTPELVDWYHKFGFTGNRLMQREPVAKLN